jgi:hypothetical protein
MALAKNPPP